MSYYGDFTNDHGLMTRFRMDTRYEKDNQGSVRPYLLQRRLIRIIESEIQTYTRMAIIRRSGIALTAFERAVFVIPYSIGIEDLSNAIDIFENIGFDPMIRYLLKTTDDAPEEA